MNRRSSGGRLRRFLTAGISTTVVLAHLGPQAARAQVAPVVVTAPTPVAPGLNQTTSIAGATCAQQLENYAINTARAGVTGQQSGLAASGTALGAKGLSLVAAGTAAANANARGQAASATGEGPPARARGRSRSVDEPRPSIG